MNGQNNAAGWNRRKLLFTMLLIVSAGLVVLGTMHFIVSVSRVTTDDAYVEGRVHSIAPRIPGTVKAVLVEDNQEVKAGDILLEIDPRDYELRVNEAKAALDAETARLADAKAGIKAAAAAVEVQEAAFNQASLDRKRTEALYSANVIPREKNEKSGTAYAMAASQLKAAREQLRKAQSLRELEISLIKQREAALEVAKLNLGYTRVAAPAGGYVTRKSAEAGNQVQAGQPLMAVVALDDIWVVANYKETQLKGVSPGQRVAIKVDTFPGTVFYGKVDSIMAGTGAVFSLFPPENALGNYVKVVQRIPVKIVFDKDTDRGHVLRVGMSCIPTIFLRDE